MNVSRLPTLILILLAIGVAYPSAGQSVLLDQGESRRQRISENLKYRFPQLRQSDVKVTELEPSSTPGFDEGVLVIDGRNRMRFLTTKDDKRLYLLAADPVDASTSTQEISLELEKERQAIRREARERHAVLLSESRGLPSRGPADAPVTIVEFSDFECPFCARASETVDKVFEKYAGRIRLVYRHFPLSRHPWAEPAAIAAVCAAEQSAGAFWALHDNFFANQSGVTLENYVERSREWIGPGVNLDSWAQCAEDSESPEHEAALQRVRDDMASGRRFGVSGTPAFFINGRFIGGNQPMSTFEEAITEALADVK